MIKNARSWFDKDLGRMVYEVDGQEVEDVVYGDAVRMIAESTTDRFNSAAQEALLGAGGSPGVFSNTKVVSSCGSLSALGRTLPDTIVPGHSYRESAIVGPFNPPVKSTGNEPAESIFIVRVRTDDAQRTLGFVRRMLASVSESLTVEIRH